MWAKSLDILKIEKTNGKLFEGTLEDAGNHYYVFFKCENCGKESKKQKRRINLNGLYCADCLLKGNKHSKETKNKIGIASKKNNNIQLMKNSLLISDGVDNASKIKSVILHRKETNLKKYGGTSPMASEEVRDKVIKSNLKKSLYEIIDSGFTPLFDIDDYIGKYKSQYYKWKCNECDTNFVDKFNDKKTIPRCPKCNPYVKGYSKGEIELKDFIKGSIKYRDKFEIDAYIEDKKIGFEYDGLYWHSDIFKASTYHLNKTNYFQKKGIRVYHIFEDEWIEKKEIVKSIINTKLNIYAETIYARKCIIKSVSKVEAREFQDENHIQGKSSSFIDLGLYYNNELVSLMTFGKSRFNKNYDWELIRFVNKKNTKITGGASKLFKNFLKNHNGSIISYSDERLFDGQLYKILGFELLHQTSPQYYYIDNKGKRYNRMNFQKKLLKNKLKVFDSNLTEKENMKINGYNRIYDCGQKVWSFKGDVKIIINTKPQGQYNEIK